MNTRTTHAFTRLDLATLIAAVALAIVAVGYIPFMARPRARVCRINCVNNLKSVGLAYRMWSNDHNDLFPFLISTNQGGTLEYTNGAQAYLQFCAVSNELVSPRILVCPNDPGRQRAFSFAQFRDANLSYFIGLDANEATPQTILTGDRNILGGGSTDLRRWTWRRSIDAGWGEGIHQGLGNIGLADGSAQQVSLSALRQQIKGALQYTQAQVRILIPR